MQHLQVFVAHGVGDADVTVPSRSLLVLARLEFVAGQADVAGTVVVAGDVAHQVVRTIHGQIFRNAVGQTRKVAVFRSGGPAEGVIDIEIELRILHARLHVRVDQFGGTVGLADLVEGPAGQAVVELAGEHAPVLFRHVLGGIVAEAVEIEVLHPEQRRVGKLGADVCAFQIEGRDMVVEPGGQAEFIVELAVRPAVGRIGRSRPIRMGGQRRALDMHMVRHIIENHVLAILVRFVKQVAEFRLGAVTDVDGRGVVRPVAVIAAEPGLGIVDLSPGVPRILGDRRKPDGGHAQRVEIAFLEGLRDAQDITAPVVHLGMDQRRMERHVVVLAAVDEPVDHQ